MQQRRHEKCIGELSEEEFRHYSKKQHKNTEYTLFHQTIPYYEGALSAFLYFDTDDKHKTHKHVVLYFRDTAYLHGEPHIDARSLNAIEFIVNNCKFNGLIPDHPTHVRSEQFENYNGITLKYKPDGLGKIHASHQHASHVTGICISKDSFRIEFKPETPTSFILEFMVLIRKLNIRHHDEEMAHRQTARL